MTVGCSHPWELAVGRWQFRVGVDLRASKRLGQHFLEPAWADKVVAAIEPRPGDRFLEIGPGPGALTLRLAPRVAHVTAIEIDRGLAAQLTPRLPGNVDLRAADFLEFDPRPLAGGGPLRVAGNLPYNVSSPILFRLLECAAGGRVLSDATVMLQLEVAERILAAPGSRDYGVLSVLVQLHSDVRLLLKLPPGAFRPPPEVRSAVIGLTFRPPQVDLPDGGLLAAMVRSMFTQRRKTLANALRQFAQAHGWEPRDALQAAGIDPQRRPEALSLPELSRLAGVMARKGKAVL